MFCSRHHPRAQLKKNASSPHLDDDPPTLVSGRASNCIKCSKKQNETHNCRNQNQKQRSRGTTKQTAPEIKTTSAR